MPRSTLRTLAVLAAVFVACAGEEPQRGRVLLVGIDGASLRVALPMIREGRLPHLAGIARSGIFGPLRAHIPLLSPRIWTSIATGKKPSRHGIADFARTAEDGTRHLYQSTDRKVHALWNIVSEARLTVGVVNWWTTYPLETVNGVLVSDHLLSQEVEGRRNLTRASDAGAGPIAWPPEWAERVEALLGESGPLTDVPDPFADPAPFADWMDATSLQRRTRNDALVARIALAVERDLKPDLMMVFLPGIDRVSHRLWAVLEPTEAYEHPLPMTPEERAAGKGALEGYYAYTDALIGLLLEGYGPEDLVLVVSDHGFEAGQHLLTLTGIHKTQRAQHGVIFARGPGIAEPKTPAPVSVNDITPTILAWLGLPVGEDMDGRVASFLQVDAEVARIATHDTTPIERFADVPSGAEGAILEQLEALGYFESTHSGSDDPESD